MLLLQGLILTINGCYIEYMDILQQDVLSLQADSQLGYISPEVYETFYSVGLDKAQRVIDNLEFDIQHPRLAPLRGWWRRWFV